MKLLRTAYIYNMLICSFFCIKTGYLLHHFFINKRYSVKVNKSLVTMKKHRKVEVRKRINQLHSKPQIVESNHQPMELYLQLEELEKEFLVYNPAIENTGIAKGKMAIS